MQAEKRLRWRAPSASRLPLGIFQPWLLPGLLVKLGSGLNLTNGGWLCWPNTVFRRSTLETLLDTKPRTMPDGQAKITNKKGFLSRICGVILVPGVVPSCDRGQFP